MKTTEILESGGRSKGSGVVRFEHFESADKAVGKKLNCFCFIFFVRKIETLFLTSLLHHSLLLNSALQRLHLWRTQSGGHVRPGVKRVLGQRSCQKQTPSSFSTVLSGSNS